MIIFRFHSTFDQDKVRYSKDLTGHDLVAAKVFDNMIKLDDLNYGLFLCKKLFDLSVMENNINTQNKRLMRRILVTFSEIISNCNHLTRKDHCLKWFFNLTDNIEWNPSSKL